jgi:predicted signal transduction protein with EAL and GGDEF domain
LQRRQALLTAVYGSLAAVAGALVVIALVRTSEFIPHAPVNFWVMTILALIADVSLFGFDRRGGPSVTRTTLSVCFTFAIFLLYGAAPAIVVQTAAAAAFAWGQRVPLLRGVFLGIRLVLALAVAELTVVILHGRPIDQAATGITGRDWKAFLPPIAVWLIVSFGLVVLVRAIWTDRLRDAMSRIRDDLLGTSVVMLLVSPLLTTITGWWIALVAIPVLALNQVLRNQVGFQERLRREPVTGLLNRSGLLAGLDSLTEGDLSHPAGPRPFAVVFVNVETALAVSHSLGRPTYEAIVSVAAERLSSMFGANQVGRLTGEGFVILLPDLTGRPALDQAERAVQVLDPPVHVNRIPFGLDPIAGVAVSPQDGRELATLIGNAELAVTDAQRTGRRSAMFAHKASDLAQHWLDILAELSAELTGASGRNALTMLYQPQVDLTSRRLVGVEALVRWSHPTRGPVPTDELIDAIESSQIMHLLTRYVVHEVTTQLAAWNDTGTMIRASVNVSVNDLHNDALIDVLRSALAETGIRPDQLTVEITESALITDMPRVTRAAHAITDTGVGLSLDDFGTGYASLQQLSRLPLSEVKIDRTYIANVTTDRASQAIVRGVHGLGRTLGLAVVAEGVEDDATAAVLSRLDGIVGQGWLFGRPMLPAELDRWRREREHPPPETG